MALKTVGTVPTNGAEAKAALGALQPGECLTHSASTTRVEFYGGVGGFGISWAVKGEWEGIEVGKSLFSTIGDLRDEGAFGEES